MIYGSLIQNGGCGSNMHSIVIDDTQRVIENLGELVQKFRGVHILITGYMGFLGSNFCAFFHRLNEDVLKDKTHITCVDSKIVDLEDLTVEFTKDFTVVEHDVASHFPKLGTYDYIIHCAGIASPSYYRKYPLETINVNAISFWHMLNSLHGDRLKGFLYFSTSEIYGNPDPRHIPTREDYNGNVSCTGPRACYDESKRLGETIAVSFVKQKNIPVKIVRPFNVYGPFMRLDDRRVIPDFVKDALHKRVIQMYSDGSPTRSFCYLSDALEGFLRVLLLGTRGQSYNIGNGTEEVSMATLAHMIADLVGDVTVQKRSSGDSDYLIDNPQRRCPDISRAHHELGYSPRVSLREGLERIIRWYRDTYNIE
jgi:UDP-glucuronate decarboxylase